MIGCKCRISVWIINLSAKGILMMIDGKSVDQRRNCVYLTSCVNIHCVFLENIQEFDI
jgi:hypothetical protein